MNKLIHTSITNSTSGFLGLSMLWMLLLVVPSTGACAAEISPDLQSFINQNSDQQIPVIITLSAIEQAVQMARRLGPKHRGQIIHQLKMQSKSSGLNVKLYLQDGGISHFRTLWLINGIAVSIPAEMIKPLASLPNVEAITLDETVHLPQVLDTSTTSPEWNIDRSGAQRLWDLGYDGTGVTIAVLDSGVNIDHPDLAERWRGLTGDWFDPYNNSPRPYDFGSFHGTGVAAVALGGNTSGSWIGMAPGAKLIAAKLFRDDGTANISYIIEALQWVLHPGGNPDNAPAVINNSWGFEDNAGECLEILGFSQNVINLRNSIITLKEAGIHVVSAAGNTGPNLNTSVSPANFPESIAVGATNSLNTIAGFSSRGPSACPGKTTFPDLVAPGVFIKVATQGADYRFVSGTSFSAPHVAGAVALLLSAVPAIETETLEVALLASATDLGDPGIDDSYGHGLLDVARALFIIDESLFLGNPVLTLIGTIPDLDNPPTEILDFGFLAVEDSAQKTVTLRNSGGGTLDINLSDVLLPPPFTIENSTCIDISLAAGKECSFNIKFNTAGVGVYSGEVTIASNDPQRPALTLLVSGFADIPFPRLEIEPVTISFGQVPPGTARTHPIILTNTGTATVESLSFDQSELLPPFNIASNTCQDVLAASDTCGLNISFHPQQVGTYEGQIIITSNDPGSGAIPVLIAGTGNTPPTRPALLSPINEVRINGIDPIIFKWETATDADGDEVTHSLVLSPNNDLSAPISLNSFAFMAILSGLAVLGIGVTNRQQKVAFSIFLLVGLVYLNSCGGGGGGDSGSNGTTATTFIMSQTVDSLQAGTYYWKVIADDGRGGISESRVASFKVE